MANPSPPRSPSSLGRVTAEAPADSTDAEVRSSRSPRSPIDLKVEYKRLNTFFYDYTKNISRGGTFIHTTKPLPVGTLFVFELAVPSLPEPLRLAGEVRWIVREAEEGSASGDAQGPGMGIRFIYEDEHQRRTVERTVEDMMIASLGQRIYARLCALELEGDGA